MATYYADSTDGNTGATAHNWANAMSTIDEITDSSTLGPSANLSLQPGDYIFCRAGSAGTGQLFTETNSGSYVINFPSSDDDNPVRVFAVNDSTTAEPPADTDRLAAGTYATIDQTSNVGTLTIGGSFEIHNFTLDSGDNFTFGNTDNSYHVLEDCVLRIEDSCTIMTTANGAHAMWRNVELYANNSGSAFSFPREGMMEWNGGGFHASHSAGVGITMNVGTSAAFIWENLDLTGFTSVGSIISHGTRLLARNCLLHANTVLSPTSLGDRAARMLWMGCQTDASGVNGPSIQLHLETEYGTCVSTEAFTLAASDGTTAYAYKMTPSGTRNAEGDQGLRSIELLVPVTTSDTQIKINVMRQSASGAPAALTKETCWPEASEPANDTTQFDFVRNKEGPFKATPTSWSTNTEAWTNSPSNPTKQELTLAISPEHNGTMPVRVVYPGDSETGDALDLYICPKVVVT